MSLKNICTAIIYILLLGAFISAIIFKQSLRPFPNINQLKHQIQTIRKQSIINIYLPLDLQSKLNKTLTKQIKDKLFPIFQFNSHKQSQYYYNLQTGYFTNSKQIPKQLNVNINLNTIQTNLNNLLSITEEQSNIGTYQYIQVLNFNSQTSHTLSISQNISKLLTKLRIPSQSFYTSNIHIKQYQIDQNYRNSQLNTLEQYTNKLNQNRYLYNCKYTHTSCQETIFIISKSIKQYKSIQNINNMYLLGLDQIDLIQKLLLLKYGFNNIKSSPSITLHLWYRIQSLKILSRIHHQIQYLQNIQSNKFYYTLQQLQLQYITNWIDTNYNILNSIKNKEYQQIWKLMNQRIIIQENSQVGKLNLFASDYKLGIYLPLIVCFLYPIVLLVKSVIVMGYQNIKQKRNRNKNKIQ